MLSQEKKKTHTRTPKRHVNPPILYYTQHMKHDDMIMTTACQMSFYLQNIFTIIYIIIFTIYIYIIRYITI